jgi:hypothetical protein
LVGFSRRWIAYVDCDKDYKDKFELLGPAFSCTALEANARRCGGKAV